MTLVGGGVVTPKEGSIVNGKCQEVEPAFSEAFNFSLRVSTGCSQTYTILSFGMAMNTTNNNTVFIETVFVSVSA